MELFDVIKTIFKGDKEWSSVGRNDKVRNFFMINRIMSIQFPAQAHQFNHIKISPGPVVDWWHGAMSNRYSRSPQWIFTKTQKTNKTEVKSDSKDFPEAETFVRERFEISKREIQELKNFFPEKYSIWIEGISDQIKASIQKEN